MDDSDTPRAPGLIAANIVGFARGLRAAGLPVGPGAVLDALNALRLIDIGRRDEVYTTLQAIFVTRREHMLIFAQAFDLFFRVADEWKHLLESIPLPPEAQKPPAPAARRVQEAFSATQARDRGEIVEDTVQLSVSDREVLQRKDFAQMSAAEIAEATAEVARMRLPQAELTTRRFRADRGGRRLDLRRTVRDSLRSGGEIVDLQRLGRRTRPAPIVALLDISGSMSEYTRLFLHFLHAVTDARKRVSVFLFGTRLTNVTRPLRMRDPDEALAACSAAVADWAGGTRIATSLQSFNKLWARRVLGQGAIVLLISDGLEREADQRLAFEMDRLRRSCRRLIWLNPLLRFEGFEPKAQGIKMMLPHVDEFRTVHNLNSIKSLIEALSAAPPPRGREAARPAA
jgi:uncharacterized protein with von Willebrand factor type A (vWA) domain